MIFGVRVSSSEVIFQKEPGFALPDLKEGQLVKAKVLGLLGQDKANLLVAGQKVVAKIHMPLMPGETILLQFTRAKDILSFKLVDSPSSSRQTFSLVRFVSQVNDVLPEFGKLKDPDINKIFHTLSLKSGKRDDSFLPRLLDNLGITLEKKLGKALVLAEKGNTTMPLAQLVRQDLKAAVLNRLSLDTSDGRADSKNMGAMSTLLDGFGQLNSQTSESGRFILPFPVMNGEQFNFGQLYVNTGKKGEGTGKDEDRVIQLAFLLNMTALGSVRADFSVLKKSITGRFLVENQETCDHIQALVPELSSRLLKIDYQALNIDCKVAEPKALSQDALIKSMLDPEKLQEQGRGLNQGLDLIV